MSKMDAINVQMIGLYVSDFERCVAFYRGLGIPLKVDAHGSYHHAEHSFQNPYFHIALFPAESAEQVSHAHVAFRVEDCKEATRRAVAGGGEIVEHPKTVEYSGGGVTSLVRDPAGNIVELFQGRQQ